jgi:hypothetical protein
MNLVPQSCYHRRCCDRTPLGTRERPEDPRASKPPGRSVERQVQRGARCWGRCVMFFGCCEAGARLGGSRVGQGRGSGKFTGGADHTHRVSTSGLGVRGGSRGSRGSRGRASVRAGTGDYGGLSSAGHCFGPQTIYILYT